MQTDASKIWIWEVDTISYVNNRRAEGASIVVESQVRIFDEAFCVSQRSKAVEKGMNPFPLSSLTMSK